MTPHYADDSVTLHHGDCLDVLRELPDNSVDSVCTDPPYGLGFMGKEWDSAAALSSRPPSADATDERFAQKYPRTGKGPAAVAFNGIEFQRWCLEWAVECLRVLKPGGHLLAFGGTRTWHRLTCAVEDAGFEIRDSIAWLYGSGFPKSLDVSKAIDKARNEDIEPAAAVARWLVAQLEQRGLARRDVSEHFAAENIAQQWTTVRADRAVKPRVPRWEQWLELKSWLSLPPDMDAEVWRLNGRKGKPGDNFDAREIIGAKTAGMGTGQSFGMLQSEGSNGEADKVVDITAPATPDAQRWQGWGTALKPAHEPIVVARKPLTGTVAQTVLTHGTGAINVDGCRVEGAFVFGWSKSGSKASDNGSMSGPNYEREAKPDSAAGRWPTNVVLDGDTADELGEPARFFPTFTYQAKAPSKERPKVDDVSHPTVKPLALMRWLVRLVTPPGGTVLEPFAGSGTTIQACRDEGLRCIAIEREADYLPLILNRLGISDAQLAVYTDARTWDALIAADGDVA